MSMRTRPTDPSRGAGRTCARGSSRLADLFARGWAARPTPSFVPMRCSGASSAWNDETDVMGETTAARLAGGGGHLGFCLSQCDRAELGPQTLDPGARRPWETARKPWACGAPTAKAGRGGMLNPDATRRRSRPPPGGLARRMSLSTGRETGPARCRVDRGDRPRGIRLGGVGTSRLLDARRRTRRG
jgi:hypothetical protein